MEAKRSSDLARLIANVTAAELKAEESILRAEIPPYTGSKSGTSWDGLIRLKMRLIERSPQFKDRVMAIASERLADEIRNRRTPAGTYSIGLGKPGKFRILPHPNSSLL